MTLTDYVVQKASRAKAAARQLATLSTVVKNKALLAMADALEAREAELLEANKKDLAGARGLSKAAIDRLTLNAKRIKEMAVGLREVAALPDPVGATTVTDNPDRQVSALLLKQDKLIDLIIPRGGEDLMQFIIKESTIPVIKHDKGVCHTYVDDKADLAMAEAICFNAKVQRPATCNAMETLLVHQTVAPTFLPPLIKRYQEAGVEIRGCPRTVKLAPGVKPAADSD